MKKWISVIALLVAITISGCNSGNKSEKTATYDYKEPNVEMSAALKAKIGDWAKKGIECYGVVVAVDKNGIPQHGLPVKAKIIRIKKDEIKMKAMESVNIGPKEGCNQMGMSYGETWWEKDGDLFQTKEKAEAFLRKQGLLQK